MRHIILILLDVAQQAFGFKSSSFCNLVEQECVGNYDPRLDYKVICMHVKCQTPYALEVNRYFSSISYKKTTQNVLLINDRLGQNILKFRSYKNKIRNCSKLAYEFKPNDVCVSGKMCFLNEKSPSKFNFFDIFSYRKYALKKINCVCEAKHTYRFGQGHCSINKQACDPSSILWKRYGSVREEL